MKKRKKKAAAPKPIRLRVVCVQDQKSGDLAVVVLGKGIVQLNPPGVQMQYSDTPGGTGATGRYMTVVDLRGPDPLFSRDCIDMGPLRPRG